MSNTNKQKFDALPQRQKKYAKTKTALLNALLEELSSKPLTDVAIKALCKTAEVSEPTFFNYFDSKQHMLVYFIQLWSVEMNALAKTCEATNTSYTETIKHIFVKTAQQISAHPRIMQEVLAFQALNTQLHPHNISDGEKWIFFSNITDVENLEGMGLDSILPPLISKAVSAGELDQPIDQELFFLTLSSLFMGTSLLVLQRDPQFLPDAFAAQLDYIFSRS